MTRPLSSLQHPHMLAGSVVITGFHPIHDGCSDPGCAQAGRRQTHLTSFCSLTVGHSRLFDDSGTHAMPSPLARIRISTDSPQVSSSLPGLLMGLFATFVLLMSSSSALTVSRAVGEGGDRELTPALRAAGVTEADLAGPGDPEVDR